MENTQRIWILYIIVLSLNAEEGAISAKRHLIINAAELIQHIYFENALTPNLSQKVCYFGEGVLLLFPQKMGSCGFILSKEKPGLIKEDSLRNL